MQDIAAGYVLGVLHCEYYPDTEYAGRSTCAWTSLLQERER
jgi:hypothetical protein